MSADNNRRLENIVRFGNVLSINPSKPTPKVQVNLGDITTPEIRWLNLRSGDDRTWDPPTIGEECVVFSPSGEISELSFCICGFNNDEHPAPSVDLKKRIRMFSDGCVFAYDTHSHVLEAMLPAGGSARIKANVTIDGSLHATGQITTDADVKAGEISLKQHKTKGVQTGSGTSGEPIP